MTFPFKYLGLRIGGNPRKDEFWRPIANNIKSRLSMWKGRLLSMAERICLIKLVIFALPLFNISSLFWYVRELKVFSLNFCGVEGRMVRK